jgi:hypothetical protein
VLVEAKGKNMLERIAAAVAGRPGAAMLMLVLHKLVDLVTGDAGKRHGDLSEKQAHIERVTRDGMGGALAPCQGRLKPVDGGLADSLHRLPPLEALPRFDLPHGLGVLGACGPVIQWRITERHLERAGPQALFAHLQ